MEKNCASLSLLSMTNLQTLCWTKNLEINHKNLFFTAKLPFNPNPFAVFLNMNTFLWLKHMYVFTFLGYVKEIQPLESCSESLIGSDWLQPLLVTNEAIATTIPRFKKITLNNYFPIMQSERENRRETDLHKVKKFKKIIHRIFFAILCFHVTFFCIIIN